MASKCTKCGDTDNYNFALNIGLCNMCIGEKLEELEAENKELQEILHYGNIDKTMVSVIGKAMEEKRKAEQALKPRT